LLRRGRPGKRGDFRGLPRRFGSGVDDSFGSTTFRGLPRRFGSDAADASDSTNFVGLPNLFPVAPTLAEVVASVSSGITNNCLFFGGRPSLFGVEGAEAEPVGVPIADDVGENALVGVLLCPALSSGSLSDTSEISTLR